MRIRSTFSGLVAAALLGGGGAAWGQFNNGNFETGDLSGWTVRNTPNGVGAPGTTEQYDIDGPGPKTTSWAAKFAVGQATFQSGVQEGVEIVQTLNLVSGVTYTISYSWATRRDSGVQNAAGGRFHVIIDGNIIGTPFDSGAIGGGAGCCKYGDYSVQYTATATGPHEIGARITRPFLSPGDVFQYVDDFNIDPPTGGGPTIRVTGQCPGRVTVAWSDATASRPMGILFSSSTGSFVIPGGVCAGTQTGLSGSGLQVVFTGNTGPNGSGQVSANAGTPACRKYLQMVVADGSPCSTSNVVQIP